MVILIEDLLFLLAAIGLLYEVLIPIAVGRQLFPHFRKSTWTEIAASRAAHRLQQARIRLEAAQMEAEAKRVEDEAQRLNQK